MSEPFLHTLGKCDISPMKLYSLEEKKFQMGVSIYKIGGPGYIIKRGRGF